MPDFTAFLADTDDGCRLKLSGEFDLTGREVTDPLLDSVDGSSKIVLDLSELEFIDSTGIHFVVVAAERARESGWDFTIVRGGPVVDRVFKLIGLDQTLPFADGA